MREGGRMKGYKVFNKDWTCRGFYYEVGKTYEMKEDPVCCERGFHFCGKLIDCFNYYDEEREEVMSIPNFDKEIFKEITGIEVG